MLVAAWDEYNVARKLHALKELVLDSRVLRLCPGCQWLRKVARCFLQQYPPAASQVRGTEQPSLVTRHEICCYL